MSIEGDAKIINNFCAGSGGGIAIVNDFNRTIVDIKENALISGNTSSIGNDLGFAGSGGGGVYVAGGTINLSGGTISNNSAQVNDLSQYPLGGGVLQSGGVVNITGDAVISGNSAVGGGGYASFGGVTNMTGGTISENTARNGGGVYVSGPTNEPNGVFNFGIENETATVYGCGNIIDNSASQSGGGVYIAGGDFNMRGYNDPDQGIISGNTSGNDHFYDSDGNYITLPTEKSTSGEIHLAAGNLNISRGYAKLKGNIYLDRYQSITLIGVIVNDKSVYNIYVPDPHTENRTIVKPNGSNIKDASHYYKHFYLANTNVDTLRTIISLPTSDKLFIKSQYFINGRLSDIEKGNGTTPVSSNEREGDIGAFNRISDLTKLRAVSTAPFNFPAIMEEEGAHVYISGTIEVTDEQLLIAKAKGITISRYTGFDVNGYPYTIVPDDLFVVKNSGKLILGGETPEYIMVLNGENTAARTVIPAVAISGSLINISDERVDDDKTKDGGSVSLQNIRMVDNGDSLTNGNAIYQHGDLSIEGDIYIENEIYLTHNEKHIDVAYHHWEAQPVIADIDDNPVNFIRPLNIKVNTSAAGYDIFTWRLIVDFPNTVSNIEFDNCIINNSAGELIDFGSKEQLYKMLGRTGITRSNRYDSTYKWYDTSDIILDYPNSIPPDLIQVTVTKVWDGDANPNQPKQVMVQLFKDEAAEGLPVRLDATNSWSYTWSEIDPVYTWTVDEVDIPAGYQRTIVITNTGNIEIIITNTYSNDKPNTGDNSNIALSIAFIMLALVATCITIFSRKSMAR